MSERLDDIAGRKIGRRAAIAAYGAALDDIEQCLRENKEPYVSNRNVAIIRTYRDPIALFDYMFTIPGFVIAFILTLIGAHMLDGLLGLTTLQAHGVAFVLMLGLLCGFGVNTFRYVIFSIGGNGKTQSKKSAQILNALLKKEL
ncbi:hypothetical protein [Sulfurospirillum sp. MES]|uniref:hypothetical protein n=1 Tax=Sulfurospirillum sp. MES TaxID=1565314 RepID=UPI00054333B6|nr:hypothetical protein [Sulfurospirillum sp. MES]KHG32989.1 MAG: hypothetical protein OA34_12380 [Sulfurospirillum sp. MES]